LIREFLGCKVRVKTYVGEVEGVLKAVGPSFHNGYGPMILENNGQTFLVVRWQLIQRCG